MEGYWEGHKPGQDCPCKPGIGVSQKNGERTYSYRHNSPVDETPIPDRLKERLDGWVGEHQ